MQRLLLLFLSCILLVVVHASIDFKNQDHSNYGDLKKSREHIKEHLETLSGKTDEIPPDLSDEDMIYYLFLLHDLNSDGFLDGHELRRAFTDFGTDEDATQYLALNEVTEMVDHVLEEDDLDGDGLISWPEYLESQMYHHE